MFGAVPVHAFHVIACTGARLTATFCCAESAANAGRAPDDAVFSTLREIEDAGHKVKHPQPCIAFMTD